MATQKTIEPAVVGAKAQAIFDAKVAPLVKPDERSHYALIDVDSGAYEIGPDDLALEDLLLARHPDASMVLLRADGGPTGSFESLMLDD